MPLDRGKIVRTIETVAVVSLVTVLIWLWAETESLTTQPVVARVQLVQPSGPVEGGDPGGGGAAGWPAPAVLEPSDWDGSVRVVLAGSGPGVEAVARELGQPLRVSLVGLGVPNAAGVHTADLRRAIEKLADVRRWGVSIVEVEPASLRVRVGPAEGGGSAP